MKYLVLVLALALVAACGGKEEPKAPAGGGAASPSMGAPAPSGGTPSMPSSADTAKAALQKSIEECQALIEKKQADIKDIGDKIKADPMNAAKYQTELQQIQKELAELQAKLDTYMKEAAK